MDHQSTTVARYIRRFRRATPLSPDRRRRQRAIMEEDFWWVRSHDFDESHSSVPSLPGKPVLQVPSSENPAEEPKAGTTSSTRSEEAISAPTSPEPTTALKKKVFIPCNSHVLDDACEVVGGDGPYEDSQLHGPFPPGQTSPPPVSSTQGYPGLSRLNDGDSNSHMDEVHENPTVNASIGRERVGKEGEGLGDLDARASAVLERCRQLLATPSMAPAQVDMTAPPVEGTISPTGENHLFEEKTTGFHNNISESLEERAWILCQEDAPNMLHGTGSLSKQGRIVSDKEPHRWGEIGRQNDSLAPHEDVDVDLYTVQTCHHSDDLPALHGQANSGEGGVSLLAIPSKLEHSVADPNTCYSEGAEGFDNSQMPVSIMEHERKRLGAALSVRVASDSHAGSHCASRSVVESATGKDRCDFLRLICTNRASHLTSRGSSFCSTGQFGKLSKTTLPVVMRGSKDPWNVGFAGEFAKDPVVLALNRRACQIEAELEKRNRRCLTTLAKMK